MAEIDAMSWAGNHDAVSWRAISGRDGVVTYTSRGNEEPTFQGTITKDKWTKVSERKRTYHFAGGVATSVESVSWLWVSSSGTHYIKDSYGKIHIINKAWFRVTITE